ncbi:hypothetical protein L0244_09055, partial [bacterium]|nr:hypothetical protein [bacterium]
MTIPFTFAKFNKIRLDMCANRRHNYSPRFIFGANVLFTNISFLKCKRKFLIAKIVAIICHFWYIIVMEFTNLVKIAGDEPAFETGLLLAGEVDPTDVRRQLSRWTKAGRLHQLRRGLYALAPPFQKVKPHPFVIANRMVRGSYVSCQSALAH